MEDASARPGQDEQERRTAAASSMRWASSAQ
jgi:hypothetical protein